MRNVSLTVSSGELRAVIGPNGAGKTTFFNMISGLFRPTEGRIMFDGADVTELAPERRVALGMARTFQITEVFPELSVARTCAPASRSPRAIACEPGCAAARRTRSHERVDEMLALINLAVKANRLVGELSHGDQRAAEIAMALALKPRLLLLDEPTAGMGDQETYDITALIRRLHRDRASPSSSSSTTCGSSSTSPTASWCSTRAHAGGGHAAGDRRQRGGPGGLSRESRMNALVAEGLHTYYGKSHILHGVSLEVAEGKITALLGRNGAGKTTTLRSLMGLTPPREGRVTIFGQETTRWPPYSVAALGVGYVPEGRKIFANLSVDDNLRVPMQRSGPWNAERVYELFPRLAERKANRGRQLSGGEQEMLSIGRALLLNPKLLILDEPSQGLAPLIVSEVFRVIARCATKASPSSWLSRTCG